MRGITVINTKGFSLIELIFLITILSIMATLGAVSLTHFKNKNERQVILDEIRTAVLYAKTQALQQGKPVYLTPLEDEHNWAKGMRLRFMQAQEQSLYQWQWHHPQWHISWNGARTSNAIIFSNKPAQAISNGKFTLTNSQTKEKIIVILNRLGRLRY